VAFLQREEQQQQRMEVMQEQNMRAITPAQAIQNQSLMWIKLLITKK
jgi:hypothetical protein